MYFSDCVVLIAKDLYFRAFECTLHSRKIKFKHIPVGATKLLRIKPVNYLLPACPFTNGEKECSEAEKCSRSGGIKCRGSSPAGTWAFK